MESLPELEMSIPSTTGHNGHEMPPNHGQIYDSEGALPTGNWHLTSASTKIKSQPLQTDIQHPLRGVQVGDQKYGTLCSGTNWKNRPTDGQVFSGKDFYESKFLYLLTLRETLTSQNNGPGSPGCPSAAFLLLLISGPCIFNLLVGLFLLEDNK